MGHLWQWKRGSLILAFGKLAASIRRPMVDTLLVLPQETPTKKESTAETHSSSLGLLNRKQNISSHLATQILLINPFQMLVVDHLGKVPSPRPERPISFHYPAYPHASHALA